MRVRGEFRDLARARGASEFVAARVFFAFRS